MFNATSRFTIEDKFRFEVCDYYKFENMLEFFVSGILRGMTQYKKPTKHVLHLLEQFLLSPRMYNNNITAISSEHPTLNNNKSIFLILLFITFYNLFIKFKLRIYTKSRNSKSACLFSKAHLLLTNRIHYPPNY